MNINYVVYDTETNMVTKTLFCNPSSIQYMVKSSESYVEGSISNNEDYYIDGVFVKRQNTTDEDIRFTEIEIRRKRNLLLSSSDWTQGVDSPLSDTQKSAWATYRTALRDLPSSNSSTTSIEDVTWPTKPS